MKTIKKYPIDEVEKQSGVSKEIIFQFISYEWIIPASHEQGLLDDEDLARLKLILELKNKMGVNDEGISIILHLVDQLYTVHYGDQRS